MRLPCQSLLTTTVDLRPPLFFNETTTSSEISLSSSNKNTSSDELELVEELKKLKFEIDKFPYNLYWDQYKRFVSPYERVHLSRNIKKQGDNIAKLIPLSRSYFKMIEM